MGVLDSWKIKGYLVIMSPKAEKLVTEAMQLPKEARAFMAEKLLESLDFDEAFEVSPEWRHEIRRRSQELDEGRVSLVPGEQVFDEVIKKPG